MSNNKDGGWGWFFFGFFGGLAAIAVMVGILPMLSATGFAVLMGVLYLIYLVSWFFAGWMVSKAIRVHKPTIQKYLDSYSRLKDPSHYTKR